MAAPEQPSKIRLQGVGWMPATPATAAKVGDQRMYNGGSVYQITRIKDATPKFFDFTEISTETGEEHTHRVRKDRPLVLVPEEHRRPLGHTNAPADTYRAQVRAPQHGEWVTISYGATVKDATDGLTASRQRYTYFGSVMLDNHGLGWTKDNPDGREASVKAMTAGETLTAADGHSFRILPPEQEQAPARPAVRDLPVRADMGSVRDQAMTGLRNEMRAEGLNTGALTLDAYGYIQRPESGTPA